MEKFSAVVLAVRAAADFERGLVARTILRSRSVAVASPDYLARHGTPLDPRELVSHRCLLGFVRGEIPETHWPTRSGHKIAVTGCFFANDVNLRCDAAQAGIGLALVPRVLIERELGRGELVPVLEDSIGSEERIAIVYPEKEFVPAQVRALIDALVSGAPTQLAPALAGDRSRIHGADDPHLNAKKKAKKRVARAGRLAPE